MIRLGVFSDEISQDFEKAVKLSVEYGIQNLEIRSLWGKNVGELTRDDVSKAKEIVDDYGAKVAVIGSPFLKIDLDDEEAYRLHKKIFDNCIYQAHKFETDIIRAFAFKRSRDMKWDIRIDKLRPHVKRAEEEGIILAEETERSSLTRCSEIRKLLDALPSESLKVAWDVANSYYEGELGYPDGYQLIRGEIVHLHLKDFKMLDLAFKRRKATYIGEGLIPYEDVFNDLLKDGFDGVASIEAGRKHFKAEGEMAIRRHVANLRDLLAKARSGH